MKGDNKRNIGDFVEAEHATSDKNPNSISFHQNNLNPNNTITKIQMSIASYTSRYEIAHEVHL